jgi:tetratricopeptide (TPR) repeat protein
MERVLKWRRRHPQALLIGLLSLAFCLCLLGSVALVWTSMQHRIQTAEQVLMENSREYLKSGPHDGAKLRDTLASLDNLVGVEELRGRYRTAIDKLEIEEEVDRMHRLAERLRLQDRLDSESMWQASTVRDEVARVWNNREKILNSARGAYDPMRTEQIRSELAEIAVWLSQSGSEDVSAIIQQAETALGDNMILKLARANQMEGNKGGGDQYRAWLQSLPTPNTAWERVALGRAWMKLSEFGRAIALFDAASEIQPQFFWPHFYKAVATYREGKWEQSVPCWTTCIALAPERAECYLNRAICYEALGRFDKALQDDNQALQKIPRMNSAVIHRSYVHVKLGQLDMATRDLQLAKEYGADANSLELGEAWVLYARGEKVQAAATLQRVLERAPNHRGAMALMRDVSRSK